MNNQIRISALILVALCLCCTTTIGSDCDLKFSKFRATIDKDVVGYVLPVNEKDDFSYTVEGAKFYDISPSGEITYTRTISIKTEDDIASLRPENCLFDLAAYIFVLKRTGNIEKQLEFATEAAREILSKTPREITDKLKENVATVESIRFLFIAKIDENVFCFVSEKSEEDESVIPMVFTHTSTGWKMTPFEFGKKNPMITNIWNALWSLVKGKSKAIHIEEIK